MLSYAIAILGIASPQYKLIETIKIPDKTITVTRSTSHQVIGSPLAKSFYIEEHVSTRGAKIEENHPPFSTGWEYQRDNTISIYQKTPLKEPTLFQKYNKWMHFVGTNVEGRPVYEKPTSIVIGPNGDTGARTNLPAGAIIQDSGTKYQSIGDQVFRITGPLRRVLPGVQPGTAALFHPSIAVWPQKPKLISSDGKNHLIALTEYTENGDTTYKLSLYQWGEVNQLNFIKSIDIPARDGNKVFKVKALVASGIGQCILSTETWIAKNKFEYENKTYQSALYIDIETNDRSLISSNTSYGPTKFSHGEWFSQSKYDVSTIQGGKFLAIEDWNLIKIYQRQ
jgi:hypothetical protein